jgi:hypothetical protein
MLWPPFAAVGLAGGWILWGIHQVGWMHSSRGWLVAPAESLAWPILCSFGVTLFALVPVAMHWLGVLLEARLHRSVLPWLFALSAAGGALIGGISVGLNAGIDSAPDGAFFGLIYAAPFAVAATAMVLAARSVRARAGTPPGRAERRAPWLAAAACVAIAMPIMKQWVPPLGTVPLALTGFAAGTVAIVLAIDLAELLPMCALLADALTATPRLGTAALSDAGARCVDLGVGDGWFDHIERGAPFRGADRLVRTLRGDPPAAQRALVRAIVRDVAVLLLCGALFILLAGV